MQTPNLKLVWVVTLLFIAGGAYLSARLASVIIAKRTWVAEAPRVAAGDAEASRTKRDTLSDYRVISERSLFNAHPAPPPPPPPPAVAIAPPIPQAQPTPPPPPPPPPPEPPPPDLKVVGTAVVEGGKSFALIAAGQDMRVVREKEEVVPGAVLTEVRSDRILVSWRGKIEEYPLFEERRLARPAAPSPAAPVARGRLRPAPPRAPEPSPAPVQTPPPDTQSAGQESVRQVSEDKWLLATQEVDQLRSNMSSLMTQIRVVPNFTDGQPDGFKVFAIRPGSIFARIGLQNGDVIKRINGLEIQGPEQAFAAYQQLAAETNIQIDLVRRSENKTLTYEIR